MKEFTVFLACAAKLQNRQGDCDWERERFETIVKDLSKTEYEPYGIQIVPLQSEDGRSSDKDGIQDSYYQQIRDSCLCFVLIGHYAGDITQKEYTEADKARTEKGHPRVGVLFRQRSKGDASVDKFWKRVWAEAKDREKQGGRETAKEYYPLEYSDKAAFERTVLDNIRDVLQEELKEAKKQHQEKEKKKRKIRKKFVGCIIASLAFVLALLVLTSNYRADIPPQKIIVDASDMEPVSVDEILSTLNGTGKGMIEDAQNISPGKDGHLGDTIQKVTISPGRSYPLFVSQPPGEKLLVPIIENWTLSGRTDLSLLHYFSSNDNAAEIELKLIPKEEFTVKTSKIWSEENGSGSVVVFSRNGKKSTPIYVAVQSPISIGSDSSIITDDERANMGWD